jgi:hypothetical protein
LPWQVPLQRRAVPEPVEVKLRVGVKTTFTTPFTWSVGPVMAAVAALVPEAMPLWHSEQLKLLVPCFECRPVKVFGMLWQALQASVPPVQRGTAVVFPFVKFPWQ